MSGFWLGEPEPEQLILARQAVLDDLGTRTDAARALDISPFRMHKWLERRDRIMAPKPLKRFGHIDVYSMAEWKRWYGDWITRQTPDKGWRNTKMHGEGESFFTYWR